MLKIVCRWITTMNQASARIVSIKLASINRYLMCLIQIYGAKALYVVYVKKTYLFPNTFYQQMQIKIVTLNE